MSSTFKPVYFIAVLTVTLGASTQFYSYGIVNPEQTLITQWINTTYAKNGGRYMTETELNWIWSLMVGSISIGAIFGSLLTRTLAERFGRRNGLIGNGIVNVFAALLEFSAKYVESPTFLIIGRLILGANMGLTSGLVPMYLMEITPSRYRGAAGTLHMVAVAFSDWFSLLMGLPAVLGSEKLWPFAFGFPGFLALGLVMILPFCPESPKYTLMMRGNREQALHDIKRFVHEHEAQEIFHGLIKEAALSKEGTGTYKELFTRRELRIPLLVSILVMIAQQFTGCTVVFAYSTNMFINAQLPEYIAQYATLGIGIVYFLFACTSPFLIERVGRRILSLFQLTSCLIALTILAIFTYIQQHFQTTWASYASIGALVVYMCVYGVGSPIPWMITSELFTTQFRSSAVTVAVFVAYFFSFMVSTSYLPFQQLVGDSFSFLPFIGVSCISIVLVYLLLPETRGKSIETIMDEFRFRRHSLATGHPFRTMPKNDENQNLLTHRNGSVRSFHSYKSING